MDLGLAGKVAVITGGTSGIGLATARLFLAEGAAVAICGRDEARLASAKSSLLGNAPDDDLLAMRCNVLDKDEVAALAAAVETWKGRCDILVNNAGQARMSTFADTSDEAWREELELKFFSQIYPVRAFNLSFLNDGINNHLLQRKIFLSIIIVASSNKNANAKFKMDCVTLYPISMFLGWTE